MRLHIQTTPSRELIPFNYQPILTGALHKWLGKNEIHDKISLYSFSWLRGGERQAKGLIFPDGASWFISMHDPQLLKRLITRIQTEPRVTNDLQVIHLTIQENPHFNDEAVSFQCASPILVKRNIEGRERHFTFDQPECDQFLTETLRKKLKIAGLDDRDISVEFDRTYSKAKTKVIYYNNVGNRVNLCPIKIKGTPTQLSFAWDVGIGNSTGVGFGALN